ncbi:MAG: hypothetical protein ABFC89_04270 [Methanospirillum sp.]
MPDDEETEDAFFKRVTEQIVDSGLPLELRTFLLLDKNGWYVEPNVFYSDIESNDKREIDLIAKKRANDLGRATNERILIIECKKNTSKPWVFFKQEKVRPFVSDLNVIQYGNCGAGFGYWDMTISKGAHHFCKYPIHTCSLVPFSNRNESNQIFGAVEQVLSALSFYANRAQRQLAAIDPDTCSPHLEVVYPVIVFDGRLLSASINGDEIHLEDTPVIHYRVYNELMNRAPLIIEAPERSTYTTFKSYIISIIHKDHFEEYIRKWFN